MKRLTRAQKILKIRRRLTTLDNAMVRLLQDAGVIPGFEHFRKGPPLTTRERALASRLAAGWVKVREARRAFGDLDYRIDE